MAYLPGTILSTNSFIAEMNTTQTCIVLTDGMVMCLSGHFKCQTMKLIDWLIQANGKEVVIASPGNQAIYLNTLQVKAGLIEQDREKIAQDNLNHAAAMWTKAKEDLYS